jgi:hypothetical protein
MFQHDSAFPTEETLIFKSAAEYLAEKTVNSFAVCFKQRCAESTRKSGQIANPLAPNEQLSILVII